ncbi:hypothetical protein PR001_g19621 [Phytophthora rubi]|uniref:DDE Tnp4 domain-containing protein n=1 Tax=Phytophthora rubi TaxID=129364 RepID=A0A6A3JPW4_9STRA|nr:hypothetical protein PR001_g19621 [Phytophthora rubi]
MLLRRLHGAEHLVHALWCADQHVVQNAEKSGGGARSGAGCYAPARISWPSPSRQTQLAKLVEVREPLLKHTFGFIDGKNFRVQQPSSADLQNAMYNGWLHSVFVTGTICFAADGCIMWCKHNCPGSWNDYDMSLEFRMKLTNPMFCPDERMNVVSDSAFPCSSAMSGESSRRSKTAIWTGSCRRCVARHALCTTRLPP